MTVRIRLIGDKEKVLLLVKAISVILDMAKLEYTWKQYPMYLDKARTKVDETRIRLYGKVKEGTSSST